MKKTFLLPLAATCLLFVFSMKGFGQSIEKSLLTGSWQQCDSTGKAIVMDAGVVEYKLITPENFTVLQARKNDGVFMAVFFGTYSLENDTYTENLVYTAPGMLMARGGKNLFKISLKNNLLYLKGINNTYSQIWKKAEAL
ncbi:MAG TPA: hypothetical protein VK152_05775 [Paludibacter sp.]|nr:hypothetical protein [Paludibacter sp.]